MNERFNEQNAPNNYEGNGWSKYQIMVLQQLEDHNAVLQNLNKEIIDIKQTMAINASDSKHWRGSTESTLDSVNKKLGYILYDEAGVCQKVNRIEREADIDKKSTLKTKAVWAVYGAIIVFFVDVVFKFVNVLANMDIIGKK